MQLEKILAIKLLLERLKVNISPILEPNINHGITKNDAIAAGLIFGYVAAVLGQFRLPTEVDMDLCMASTSDTLDIARDDLQRLIIASESDFEQGRRKGSLAYTSEYSAGRTTGQKLVEQLHRRFSFIKGQRSRLLRQNTAPALLGGPFVRMASETLTLLATGTRDQFMDTAILKKHVGGPALYLVASACVFHALARTMIVQTNEEFFDSIVSAFVRVWNAQLGGSLNRVRFREVMLLAEPDFASDDIVLPPDNTLDAAVSVLSLGSDCARAVRDIKGLVLRLNAAFQENISLSYSWLALHRPV